ncbi:MAG: amino acid permease [Desulfitobacteriaceae bacterium]
MSSANQDQLLEREHGLQRQLTRRQLTMIAMGGAIGTGLFLGSGFAVSLAGPGVIISYVIGVFICLIMMFALSEMTVVHPTAGSFGVFAEKYINPWAGFVTRYTYWLAQVVAIGGEVTAAAIYTKFWFPSVPMWIWVILYSAVLIYVNLTSVKNFGEFEYWFAMIKVSAIVLFIILGIGYVFTGFGSTPVGFSNLTANGGFLPKGFTGVLKAMLIVIFSFYGVEVIAVTAGEAKDPEVVVPKAMKAMVFRLSAFYILAIALVVTIVPWAKAGISESPFVLVFQGVGIPYAAGIMNFVVLTAALSSMNTNLYLTGRMLFSLSRSGMAPKRFGVLTEQGSPRNAILISTIGLLLAAILSVKFAASAYMYLFGISIFGGIFVWIMILITLLAFRKKRAAAGLPQSSIAMPWYPYLAWVGIIALTAILIDCLFIDLKIAWYAGVPWLILISLAYYFNRKSIDRVIQQEQAKL